MRPYHKKHKNSIYINRYKPRNFVENLLHSTINVPVGIIWDDVKYIWIRDPPFPASIRIILSSLLFCVVLVPLLFILVPPLLSIFFIHLLYCEYLPSYQEWLQLPDMPPPKKLDICRLVKDIFKRVTLKLSIFVTLCDYIQTFRALGFINF